MELVNSSAFQMRETKSVTCSWAQIQTTSHQVHEGAPETTQSWNILHKALSKSRIPEKLTAREWAHEDVSRGRLPLSYLGGSHVQGRLISNLSNR